MPAAWVSWVPASRMELSRSAGTPSSWELEVASWSGPAREWHRGESGFASRTAVISAMHSSRGPCHVIWCISPGPGYSEEGQDQSVYPIDSTYSTARSYNSYLRCLDARLRISFVTVFQLDCLQVHSLRSSAGVSSLLYMYSPEVCSYSLRGQAMMNNISWHFPSSTKSTTAL